MKWPPWRDPKSDPPPVNTMVMVSDEKRGVRTDFITTASMFTKGGKITGWLPFPPKHKPRGKKK